MVFYEELGLFPPFFSNFYFWPLFWSQKCVIMLLIYFYNVRLFYNVVLYNANSIITGSQFGYPIFPV